MGVEVYARVQMVVHHATLSVFAPWKRDAAITLTWGTRAVTCPFPLARSASQSHALGDAWRNPTSALLLPSQPPHSNFLGSTQAIEFLSLVHI
jgi:hypothetical protein